MADVNTNRVTQTIPLDVHSPDYPTLIFLRAEVNARQYTPFALIFYAIDDGERARALRLDLVKRRFIDPADAEPNNDAFERAVRRIAPYFAERVSAELIKVFSSEKGASPFF
jgi:hypothetical protein